MAFRQCFFDTPEVTKLVLQKVLQNFEAPKCTYWPRELIQINTIPAETERSPFQFFRHCATFFRKNTQRAPVQFVDDLKLNG